MSERMVESLSRKEPFQTNFSRFRSFGNSEQLANSKDYYPRDRSRAVLFFHEIFISKDQTRLKPRFQLSRFQVSGLSRAKCELDLVNFNFQVGRKRSLKLFVYLFWHWRDEMRIPPLKFCRDRRVSKVRWNETKWNRKRQCVRRL